MRKHGRRGTLSSRLWSALLGGDERRKIQLSFEPGRQSCSWLTGERRTPIKH